ncbi:hypothetical protein N8996_04680 [Candidatus Poseidonia alphae]|nr:hypothetical protein [Candidatus Poseidonia alphae]
MVVVSYHTIWHLEVGRRTHTTPLCWMGMLWVAANATPSKA